MSRRRVPSFLWTLLVGAVLFVAGSLIFFWASSASGEEMERLPWIAQVVVYVILSPMGWLLLGGPVVFIAVYQLLRWLESRPPE